MKHPAAGNNGMEELREYAHKKTTVKYLQRVDSSLPRHFII
jgi:hypothetical protein